MSSGSQTSGVRPLRILVSGASIAGPAVAWWLARYGMDVTVVERSDGIRDGGQTVYLRGESKTVVQRMGLEGAIASRLTHEEAIAFVDERGRVVAKISTRQFGGEGAVAELEILRGELAKLLVGACEGTVEFKFKDQVSVVEDDGDKVQITFESGGREAYDLFIIAEGIGSRTRTMVFGEEAKRGFFGLYTAYFTIPKGSGDGLVARCFNAPAGRGIFVRPDNLGTTRAVLNLIAPPTGLEDEPPEIQKKALRERFADAGWETLRVLDGMDASSDFYLEAIGQVRMPRWHKGRIAILGDAAFASPISGMGTALALCGAYVLAGELARQRDHQVAFARYESIVRPHVEKAQSIPSFTPRLGQPMTRLGIWFQRLVLKVGSGPIGRTFGKLFSPPADKIDLPDYGLESSLRDK